MPVVDGTHRLCHKHFIKTCERIYKACEHNADKDEAWWMNWWDKEIKRQAKDMEECCDAV